MMNIDFAKYKTAAFVAGVLFVLAFSAPSQSVVADTATIPPTPAASPTPIQTTAPTAAVPAVTPTINDLVAQLTSAKEIRFDADATFNSNPAVIEVKGTFSGASNVNIQLLKDGKQTCLVVGNDTNGGAYVSTINKYVKSNSGDIVRGPDAGPFIDDQLGQFSATALLLSETLLKHPDTIVTLPTGSTPLKWVHSEETVNGQIIEHDTATQSTGSAHEPASKSLIISYIASPYSLTDVKFVTTGDTGVSLAAFELKFNKCDLITDPTMLTDQTQFAFIPPAGSDAFKAPAPVMKEPESTALKTGTNAPPFTVFSATGTKVHLADYKGKVVVIDLWATWCGPCQMSLPHTDKIAQEYQAKGVVFMPVCVWDDKPSFTKWLGDHKSMKMHFLFDSAPSEDASFSTKLYKVDGIPTQFVIGKNGKIAATFVGYNADGDPDEHDLTSAIDKALAQ